MHISRSGLLRHSTLLIGLSSTRSCISLRDRQIVIRRVIDRFKFCRASVRRSDYKGCGIIRFCQNSPYRWRRENSGGFCRFDMSYVDSAGVG